MTERNVDGDAATPEFWGNASLMTITIPVLVPYINYGKEGWKFNILGASCIKSSWRQIYLEFYEPFIIGYVFNWDLNPTGAGKNGWVMIGLRHDEYVYGVFKSNTTRAFGVFRADKKLSNGRYPKQICFHFLEFPEDFTEECIPDADDMFNLPSKPTITIFLKNY